MSGKIINFRGRQAYIYALERYWPDTLATLLSISPIYEPVWHFDKGRRIGMRESWVRLQEDDDRKELHSRLKAWAREFFIKDEWLLDAALDTLFSGDPRNTYVSGTGQRETHWCYHPRGYLPRFSPTLEKNIWYPEQHGWPENWDAFRSRIRKQFNSQLAEYRRVVMASLVGEGDEQIARDAQWAVLYNKGVRAIDIATQTDLIGYQDCEDAIFKAIQRFARTIGLTLRKRGERSQNPHSKIEMSS